MERKLQDKSGNINNDELNELKRLVELMDGYDLTTIVSIFPQLDKFQEYSDAPSALKVRSQKIKATLEAAIMGEQDLHLVLPKIKQGLLKTINDLQNNPDSIDNAEHLAADLNANVTGASSPSLAPTAHPPVSGDLDLVQKFCASQLGQLEDFEIYAIEWEKGNIAALAEIKRYLHTLKGEFGVLDFAEYAGLIHQVEDAIEKQKFSIDNLLALKDYLSELLPQLNVGQNPQIESDVLARLCLADVPPETAEPANATDFANDPSFVADFLEESAEHIANMEDNLLKLDEDLENLERLHTFFRACHTIKGLAGFLNFRDIQELSHRVETVVDELRTGKVQIKHCHIDLLFVAVDLFKDLLQAVSRNLEGEPLERPQNFTQVLEFVQMANTSTECMLNADPKQKMGEMLVASGLVHPKYVEEAIIKQARGDKRKIGQILVEEEVVTSQTVDQALQLQQQARSAAIEESVRVPVRRLDQLIDSIGEAVIAQSMIAADPLINDADFVASAANREMLRLKVARAEIIMRQIQELSMSLRMVSIKGVFQKMGRLVRDLAQKTGKQVDLVLEGESTELDKTVIEHIGDPLVHMVRNALDHGLESGSERLAQHKPERGTLKLRAFHCAGNVHIEIQDDGRGLDKDKILAKAQERGLLREGHNLSDSEIYNFIFAPGFSTAAQVTDISGRGVGMDVVRKNIESLRGSIEISSELGRGTVFTIILPLTLAIIDGMVVRLQQERYIVPTLSIVTTLALTPEIISTVVGQGEIINVRGDLIRMVRLEKLFNLSANRAADVAGVVLVLTDATGKKVGLLVDEILEQQQVVIKNMGGGIGNIPGISGGAIMNDGTVSLILDVAMLLRQFN